VLYPLVEKYFESVQKKECYLEKELRRIQLRYVTGKFISEGYPIPDLIATDAAHGITAVEIKPKTKPGQLDAGIGKLMRMLRFANKVYGAFPYPIQKSVVDTFEILNKIFHRLSARIHPKEIEEPIKEGWDFFCHVSNICYFRKLLLACFCAYGICIRDSTV